MEKLSILKSRRSRLLVTTGFFVLMSSKVIAQVDVITNNFREDYSQSLPWKNRWYIGTNMGVALLDLSQNDIPSQSTARFALALYGGYKVFHWLRAGINVNGWLIEPREFQMYQDPKGISISNIYGQLQIFLFKRCNVYINLAGGSSEYINVHPTARNAKGVGGFVGFGFEKDFFRRGGCSIEINYSLGHFDNSETAWNQHYNILEFVVGFTYH